MKTLQPYEVDSLIQVLEAALMSARGQDDDALVNEIESVLGLFTEDKDVETDE